MKRILVVGQTPPPFGGQAVMIDYLLKGNYSSIKLIHVRMAFSKGMNDMGKLQVRKLFHLFQIVIKIYYYRIFKQVSVLYYPPSGPNSAVYRDMAILFSTRFLFKKTIFHFHASGLSSHLEKMKGLTKWVFKKSFFYPDLCIHLSESCPKEGEKIGSKKNCIVANGVPDIAGEEIFIKKDNTVWNVLFIGLLEITKGELDILKAVQILKEKGYEVHLRVAGQFKREEFKNQFFNLTESYNIKENVTYLGIIQGEEKRKAFKEANCFCFPSYFHSESFPLVLLEAMQFGLPIVATRWRGIPDMVEDHKNGFLIDIKSPEQIAEKMQILIENPGICEQMSRNGREIFKKKYEINAHLAEMEKVLSNI